jgi:TRAP-type C4-dicarboxylate transport system substrate-binding protein
MSKTTRRLTTCAAALVLACGAAFAQDKPVTLRFASNAPAKSPWATQIDRIVKNVDAETKGTVKIEPFYGGQLGNEQDTIQQVARGRIDMGSFAAGAVGLLVPEAQITILPLFYGSQVQTDCVLDQHLAKPLGDLLDKKGVVFLGYGEVGTIDLAGKKAFSLPKDAQGGKMVAYSKIQSMLWAAIGANSSFVGVPDWSSSLQTGLIDAVGAPMALYVPSGMNKIAPVLTRLELWDSPSFTIINKAIFEKMSKDQREGFLRAMAMDPAPKMRAEIRGVEGALRKAHLDSGGKIVEVTPEQREEWRKVLKPIWPQMAKEIGGDGEKLFQIADAARQSCAVK